MTNGESPKNPQRPTDFDFEAARRQHAELMDILDGMADDAHYQTVAAEKIHDSPLPEALYHATTPENAATIAQEGLFPSPLMDARHEPVVSLSDTVGFALDTASQTTGLPRDQLTVLEVTTEGQDRDHFKSYLPFTLHEYADLSGTPVDDNLPDGPIHEVHYTGEDGINPDFIYELTAAEINELLAEEAKNPTNSEHH